MKLGTFAWFTRTEELMMILDEWVEDGVQMRKGVTREGVTRRDVSSRFLELRNCSSWNWNGFMLRHGHWYRKRNGDTVGPAVFREGYDVTGTFPFSCGGATYTVDGYYSLEARHHPEDLVDCVAPPVPVTGAIRPFTKDEFAGRRGRWFVHKVTKTAYRCLSYDDTGVTIRGSRFSYATLLAQFVFEDLSPCGVKA